MRRKAGRSECCYYNMPSCYKYLLGLLYSWYRPSELLLFFFSVVVQSRFSQPVKMVVIDLERYYPTTIL